MDHSRRETQLVDWYHWRLWHQRHALLSPKETPRAIQQLCRDQRSTSNCSPEPPCSTSGVFFEIIPEAFSEVLLALASLLASLRALDFRDDHGVNVRFLSGANSIAQIVSYLPQISDDRSQSTDRLSQRLKARGRDGGGGARSGCGG